MAQGYTDNYASTLSSGYTSGAGTLVVASVSGLPVSGLIFYLSVAAEGANTTELFKCTGYTGTTLTVVGAQGNTAASNHASGATITGCWILSDVLDGIRADHSQVGPYASKPTSGMKKGDRYKCTDSPYEFLYNGSAWLAFAFGYQVTEPVLADFTQVNMGSSVLDTTHGGIIHDSPSNGSAINNHFLATAIPGSGAYYIDAACVSMAHGSNGGGGGCGLASTNTTSAVMASNAFHFESGNAWWYERQYLNSPTSFNSNAAGNVVVPVGPLMWTRVYDDRVTNRTFYISFNGGYTWRQMYQEGRTVGFTPAYATLSMNPFASLITTHWLHFSIHT